MRLALAGASQRPVKRNMAARTRKKPAAGGGASITQTLAEARHLYNQGKFQASADKLLPLVDLPADQRQTSAAVIYTDALRRAGSVDEALAAAAEMLAVQPLNATYHLLSGACYEDKDTLRDAEAHYAEALMLEPENLKALHALALVYNKTKRRKEAEALLRKYLAIEPATKPEHVPVLLALGNALRGQRKKAEALAAFEQALGLAPRNPAALNATALARLETEDVDGALAAAREATSIAPDFLEARSTLANVLRAAGQADEAIELLKSVAEASNKTPNATMQVANALAEIGRKKEAEEWHRRALEIDPKFVPSLVNLANLLKERGAHDEAILLYQRAIDASPRFAPAYNNLAVLLKDQGRSIESIDLQRKAVALQPDFVESVSNLLLSLHYGDQMDPDAVWAAHRDFNERFAASITAKAAPHDNDPNPDRRLRIGYLSPDFRRHSVAFFIEPVLEGHDKTQVEVFCYASQGKDDAITEILKREADHWRNVNRMSDDETAALIRKDRIDILVELAGHTARNRLLVMARKPAPVQMTYLGYPDTTGLEAIDWRITDPVADPPGLTEKWHSERLLRLPTGFLCYRPLPDTPEPPALPPVAAEGERKGTITFGCFNNMAKTNPALIRRWARVLEAVPGSRIMVKATPLSDPGPREFLTGLFRDAGVPEDRIELVGRLPEISDHLKHYRHVDIALDTFPYNGTTITCEALYMGVPLITLAGAAHVTRVGASLLTTVGAPELIAETEDDYVALAAALAADTKRLIHYRQNLRGMMERSPLMNPAAITRALEDGYRAAWREWCAAHGAGASEKAQP